MSDELYGAAPTTYTTAKHGIAASTHPLAAQIGVDVLKAGGNAVDAAIATNAAMGLMEPASCGIGGDLFAIVYTAKDKKLTGLTASGRSPQNLSLQILKDKGLSELPTYGPLSWSVPGCVDGWDCLLKKFGTKPLSELLAPSIHYAEAGFPVPPMIAAGWKGATAFLSGCADSAATFLPGGQAPEPMGIFRNPHLAASYREIAKGGRDAYYQGSIAQRIVDFSKANGGYFSLGDFSSHTSTWVDLASTDYRGYRVHEIPPPGQGISVLQMLNLLEAYDLQSMGADSADWWHLFIEAKKLAYADRAQFYADPAFANVPIDWLISKAYAKERRKLIDMKHALENIEPGDPKLAQSDTIYQTVVDKDRNCVSLIQSNYHGFGSGLVPGNLGFALQNRGTLFAMDPKHPNCFAPKKRPFHTIIPGFVTKNGQPYFCFGVMGGDFQPQGQVQVLVNHLDFGMDIFQAGKAGRMAHEGSATPTGRKADGSGKVSAEEVIPQSVLDDLKKRGHRIAYGPKNGGGYQGILIDAATGMLQGASEPRRDGRAVGY